MPKLEIAGQGDPIEIPVTIGLERVGSVVRVTAQRGSELKWNLLGITEAGVVETYSKLPIGLGFYLEDGGHLKVSKYQHK
jgi:hypothetical protein